MLLSPSHSEEPRPRARRARDWRLPAHRVRQPLRNTGLAVIVAAAASAKGLAVPIEVGQFRQLFVDDHVVAACRNVRRDLGLCDPVHLRRTGRPIRCLPQKSCAAPAATIAGRVPCR